MVVLSVIFDFLGLKTLTNKVEPSKQVMPSIQNKLTYPTDVMINPPIAGPAENPRFIANLINVNERVLFLGLLQLFNGTNIAGLKLSAISITKKYQSEI